MRAERVLIVAVSSFFLLACAAANRSARRIEPGTVTVSYLPPFSASARVALTEHVETRFAVWYDRPILDVFVRTANDQQLFNFGLAAGTVFPAFFAADYKRNLFFASFTVSTQFKQRLFPYVTYTHYSDFKSSVHNQHEVALAAKRFFIALKNPVRPSLLPRK